MTKEVFEMVSEDGGTRGIVCPDRGLVSLSFPEVGEIMSPNGAGWLFPFGEDAKWVEEKNSCKCQVAAAATRVVLTCRSDIFSAELRYTAESTAVIIECALTNISNATQPFKLGWRPVMLAPAGSKVTGGGATFDPEAREMELGADRELKLERPDGLAVSMDAFCFEDPGLLNIAKIDVPGDDAVALSLLSAEQQLAAEQVRHILFRIWK